MKILVTGAAGRLGSVVCRELLSRGHEVRATDQRFSAESPVSLDVADIRDEHTAYRLLQGMDGVAHLANYPNLSAGPSPQAVLVQNTAMNVNVFRAAVDLGLKRIVFASSIQAMVRLEEGRAMDPPYTLPYLPLDGEAPANPGGNFYGLSKEFGERTLRILCAGSPELSATALRFPLLATDWWLRRMRSQPFGGWLNPSECFSYLEMPDAGRVVALALERQKPGYHQYFPAQELRFTGCSIEAVIEKYYPETTLKRPRSEIQRLIDGSALEAELGFSASPSIEVPGL